MSQKIPSARVQDLAQRLFAYESATENSPGGNVPMVSRIAEKLRYPLSVLAGATGFQALLARALKLTKTQIPGLNELQVKSDGSLEGVSELQPQSAREAGVLLIAHLLALLVAFVGEELTLHLLTDAWPNLLVITAELTGESKQ